jgi:TolA-binding protein
MLQLGSVYRDKLEDYDKSIETLEKLLRTYPETKYTLDAFYQLYVSYIAIGNHAQAEYYKNRIINEYAASKYAMVLTDPDYISKQLTQEQRLDRDYREVYQLVETGEFEEAKARIDAAKGTFGTMHALQAKYSILEAMCIGNLEGKEAYVEALKAVIGSYPGTPEETKARDMLLLLGEYQGSRLNLSTAGGPNFEIGPDAQHFVLVQVSGQVDADAQEIKVSISNYNRKYHSLDKLKISSLRFDTQGDKVIILIRSFADATAAMKYLEGTKKYPDEFVPPGTVFEIFPVTQHNYREIVRQKSVDSYRKFFDENYN